MRDQGQNSESANEIVNIMVDYFNVDPTNIESHKQLLPFAYTLKEQIEGICNDS